MLRLLPFYIIHSVMHALYQQWIHILRPVTSFKDGIQLPNNNVNVTLCFAC